MAGQRVGEVGKVERAVAPDQTSLRLLLVFQTARHRMLTTLIMTCSLVQYLPNMSNADRVSAAHEQANHN